jgi:hypothetical protein
MKCQTWKWKGKRDFGKEGEERVCKMERRVEGG